MKANKYQFIYEAEFHSLCDNIIRGKHLSGMFAKDPETRSLFPVNVYSRVWRRLSYLHSFELWWFRMKFEVHIITNYVKCDRDFPHLYRFMPTPVICTGNIHRVSFWQKAKICSFRAGGDSISQNCQRKHAPIASYAFFSRLQVSVSRTWYGFPIAVHWSAIKCTDANHKFHLIGAIMFWRLLVRCSWKEIQFIAIAIYLRWQWRRSCSVVHIGFSQLFSFFCKL